MKDEIIDYFVKDGVYKLKGIDDYLFLCTSCNNSIGILVQYIYNNDIDTYEKTSVTYFLNFYTENDVKSLFLRRQNYEIEGMLNKNFMLSDDTSFLRRIKDDK